MSADPRTEPAQSQPQETAVESRARRQWRYVLGDLESHDPVPAGEMRIDPGIRRYVLILRAEGIETFESCQGGSEHAFPEPTVRFHGNAYEGFKAFAVAMTYGLPVFSVASEYSVVEGRLTGPHWRMTFCNADPDLTSDQGRVAQ